MSLGPWFRSEMTVRGNSAPLFKATGNPLDKAIAESSRLG